MTVKGIAVVMPKMLKKHCITSVAKLRSAIDLCMSLLISNLESLPFEMHFSCCSYKGQRFTLEGKCRECGVGLTSTKY